MKLSTDANGSVDVVCAVGIEDSRSLAGNHVGQCSRLRFDRGLLGNVTSLLLPFIPLVLVLLRLQQRIADNLRRLHTCNRSFVTCTEGLLRSFAQVEDHSGIKTDR